MIGHFAAETASARDRWAEPFLTELLEKVLDAARNGRDWHAILLAASTAYDDSDLEGAPFRGRDLAGIDLSGARLDYADFVGADLSHARLVDVSADHADFTGARLCDAELSDSMFARSILREADATRVRARHTSFLGADLAEANFAGADLSDSTLFGAMLDGAVFDDAVMDNVRYGGPKDGPTAAEREGRSLAAEMAAARARWTEPPMAELLETVVDAAKGGRDWHAILLAASTAYDDSDLEGALLGGRDLTGIDLSGARLHHADFTGTDLSGARLVDVSAIHADFTGATLRGADLSGSIFGRSCLRDTDAVRATARRTTFLMADLTRADFTGADLTDSTLFGAVLDGAAFDTAVMTNLRR